MKNLCLALLLAFTSTALLHADDWTNDYAAALQKAKAEKKLVLLDFTGSDWCAPCKLLHDEVFDSSVFSTYAQKNLVLVTVDFPDAKPLPDKVQKQNDALAQKYSTGGMTPVLILVDADGKELGRQLGYNHNDGPDLVISKLKSFVK